MELRTWQESERNRLDVGVTRKHRFAISIVHGATPTTSMTHIAIQEALDGKVVHWMEKVLDEQYLAGPKHRD
jgi:UDP-N-acetylmuramate-alanine ligase